MPVLEFVHFATRHAEDKTFGKFTFEAGQTDIVVALVFRVLATRMTHCEVANCFLADTAVSVSLAVVRRTAPNISVENKREAFVTLLAKEFCIYFKLDLTTTIIYVLLIFWSCKFLRCFGTLTADRCVTIKVKLVTCVIAFDYD